MLKQKLLFIVGLMLLLPASILSMQQNPVLGRGNIAKLRAEARKIIQSAQNLAALQPAEKIIAQLGKRAEAQDLRKLYDAKAKKLQAPVPPARQPQAKAKQQAAAKIVAQGRQQKTQKQAKQRAQQQMKPVPIVQPLPPLQKAQIQQKKVAEAKRVQQEIPQPPAPLSYEEFTQSQQPSPPSGEASLEDLKEAKQILEDQKDNLNQKINNLSQQMRAEDSRNRIQKLQSNIEQLKQQLTQNQQTLDRTKQLIAEEEIPLEFRKKQRAQKEAQEEKLPEPEEQAPTVLEAEEEKTKQSVKEFAKRQQEIPQPPAPPRSSYSYSAFLQHKLNGLTTELTNIQDLIIEKMENENILQPGHKEQIKNAFNIAATTDIEKKLHIAQEMIADIPNVVLTKLQVEGGLRENANNTYHALKEEGYIESMKNMKYFLLDVILKEIKLDIQDTNKLNNAVNKALSTTQKTYSNNKKIIYDLRIKNSEPSKFLLKQLQDEIDRSFKPRIPREGISPKNEAIKNILTKNWGNIFKLEDTPSKKQISEGQAEEWVKSPKKLSFEQELLKDTVTALTSAQQVLATLQNSLIDDAQRMWETNPNLEQADINEYEKIVSNIFNIPYTNDPVENISLIKAKIDSLLNFDNINKQYLSGKPLQLSIFLEVLKSNEENIQKASEKISTILKTIE